MYCLPSTTMNFTEPASVAELLAIVPRWFVPSTVPANSILMVSLPSISSATTLAVLAFAKLAVICWTAPCTVGVATALLVVLAVVLELGPGVSPDVSLDVEVPLWLAVLVPVATTVVVLLHAANEKASAASEMDRVDRVT